MNQIPCEYIVWHVLPILRKEIAKSMIKDFGLNEKQAAENLDLTPAAVSQYLSGKRGKIDITDDKVINQIKISTERILNQGTEIIVPEICRLCKKKKTKNLTKYICEDCKY